MNSSVLTMLNPVIFNFIVVLVTFKDLPQYKPASNIDDVYNFIQKDIVARVDYCSDGKSSTNFIVTNVEIPQHTDDWSVHTCRKVDQRGWADSVIEALYADQSMNSQIGNFDSVVMLFPKKWPINNNCSFAGFAELGMNHPSLVWLSSGAWANVGLYLHEIGHNWGLQHARFKDKEYGDTSSVMGAAGKTCYSSANAWKLKWIDDNDGSLVKINECGTHFTQFDKTNTFAKVVMLEMEEYFLFFQFRRYHFQDQLPDDIKNAVLVHRYNKQKGTTERIGLLRNLESVFVTDSDEIEATVVSNDPESIGVSIVVKCGSAQPKLAPPSIPPPQKDSGGAPETDETQGKKKKKKHNKKKNKKAY